MTARVITVTSGKGGVGKTTTTANLAVALALLGNKVVCIDADIGLRNLDVVMGLENRIVYDIVDVVEGRARLRQAMIRDKRLKEDLYMLPAAQTRDKTAVSPSDMVRICDELRSLVDYVIIDSPAGIERGFRNALAPADEVLIVTNPEVSSVRDADRIIGLIEAEDKGPGQLIINRVKPEMVKRGDMLSPEDVIDILSIKLIGLIPEDEAILVSTNRGHPVAMDWEESVVGRAYRNIARRIDGEDVPFMPLEDESTWLQKLLRKVRVGEKGSPPEETRPPAKKEASKAPGLDLDEDEDKEEVSVGKSTGADEAGKPALPEPVARPEEKKPALPEARPPTVETKPTEPVKLESGAALSGNSDGSKPPTLAPASPSPASKPEPLVRPAATESKPDIEIKPPAVAPTPATSAGSAAVTPVSEANGDPEDKQESDAKAASSSPKSQA